MTPDLPRLVRSSAPRPVTGIVHLGLGAFFRAFGCPYIQDAMAAGGGDWGIVGVSLRSPETRDALRPQDWAYTSVSLGSEGEIHRRIEVLNSVLVAPEDPLAVIEAMADPAVKIVTLTVTEKGYCHHPASGKLNKQHPDIQHDIGNAAPKSALGFLVRALEARWLAGLPPFTVLTCDNLPQNGRLVGDLVIALAELMNPPLAAWIADEGRFPCTMVDRITPATTTEDISRIAATAGQFDAAPVVHEPFSQWVVEDAFVGGARPDLAAVGVELVGEVSAHEDMKLRMLNGTHSALAYTGYLAGHETIADTVADPLFEQFVQGLWDEIIPTLRAPAGVNLRGYAASLFERYANPSIRHRTWQIAMDGSQKIPQRLLGTLRDTFDVGRDAPLLCLSIAAWMRYVGGIDEAGQAIDVKDPLSDDLLRLSEHSNGSDETVASLLSVRAIFPADLAQRLYSPVSTAASDVWRGGVRGAISTALGARANG